MSLKRSCLHSCLSIKEVLFQSSNEVICRKLIFRIVFTKWHCVIACDIDSNRCLMFLICSRLTTLSLLIFHFWFRHVSRRFFWTFQFYIFIYLKWVVNTTARPHSFFDYSAFCINFRDHSFTWNLISLCLMNFFFIFTQSTAVERFCHDETIYAIEFMKKESKRSFTIRIFIQFITKFFAILEKLCMIHEQLW